MEGIFWILVIVLAAVSAILAIATIAGIIGVILILASRRHPTRRLQGRVGIALVMIGVLPFLCLCLNALAGLPDVVPSLAYLPHSVDPATPEIQAMLAARLEAGAQQKCFTPIDPNARFEMHRRYGDRATHDIILSVYGSSSRTIAFKDQDGTYEWLGEQETTTGPNEFLTSSGYSDEQITVSFDTVYLSGVPLNTVFIRYSGEDPRLASIAQLTCEDIRPILIEWGALHDE
jgi:hypothetical protein